MPNRTHEKYSYLITDSHSLTINGIWPKEIQEAKKLRVETDKGEAEFEVNFDISTGRQRFPMKGREDARQLFKALLGTSGATPTPANVMPVEEKKKNE
jgi:hypothetical protein